MKQSEDFWRGILVENLKKKNVQGAGGIYGLDGQKYTTKDFFHISEPTAKTIADLFIKFEEIENPTEENETPKIEEYEPPIALTDLDNNQPLRIENEDFLIITLNSRLLYATNEKHCVFAYRCQFSFVIMLFSNFQDIKPKSPLYEKLENNQNTSLQQGKPINPEIYAKIILEIANEIINQGG